MEHPYSGRIRTLKPGERVPEHKPRRFPDRRGYIRLRWKVATNQYVETLEHRIDGGVVTDAPNVHHRNHDPGDNRPENLLALSVGEHTSIHNPMTWDVAEATRLYAEGWSTIDLGQRYCVNPVSVYRGLRKRGVSMRPPGSKTMRSRAKWGSAIRAHYDAMTPEQRRRHVESALRARGIE